jgi:hypothetical protein
MERPMKILAGSVVVCALGSLFAACYENRPLVVAATDGGGQSPTGPATGGSNGAAGTGSNGAAGTGSAGAAGQGSGAAGRGCDIGPLVTKYYCTLAGACHDAAQSATTLDMTSVGWERKLIGTFPTSGSAFPSECVGSAQPYLIAGSSPARGLFLDKFDSNPPCGIRMSPLGAPVSPADLDCFQRWANALTAP